MGSSSSLAQPAAQVRHFAASPPIRCEILPVTCTEGKIVALAPHPAGTAPTPGWHHELPPHQHPTEVVVDALEADLGAAFDPATAVVHSTSWRYEGERLVLSYLAALPPLACAPPGFVFVPVGCAVGGSVRSSDPAAIPVMDVLTHGLRHLAMLRVSDPAIGEALSGRWHDLLVHWDPLPAGLIDHCLPTSGMPSREWC